MADVTIQFQSDPGASVLGYQQGFVIHFFGELAPALPCCLGENTDPERPECSYLTGESRKSSRYHLKEDVLHLP